MNNLLVGTVIKKRNAHCNFCDERDKECFGTTNSFDKEFCSGTVETDICKDCVTQLYKTIS